MALPFKKNNPGCPCCGQPECPCACYAFDDNAEDSSISNLHLTSTGASPTDYTTGKLDKAFKHTGSQYHEHADHSCFNLGPDGINVWFWLKSGYAAPYNWGPPVGEHEVATQPEGVVTKGSWENLGSDQRDFLGEWGIFWDETSPNSTLNGQIFFVVGNGSAELYDGDAVSRAPWENKDDVPNWEFFFYWASIAEGKIYGIKWSDHDAIVSGVTVEASLTGTQTLTSGEKLYIGNNTEGKKLGEQEYDDVSRPWLIDNVGFCKDIGTKAEMEERAENLWNDGYGRACNHAGYEGGGCCA